MKKHLLLFILLTLQKAYSASDYPGTQGKQSTISQIRTTQSSLTENPIPSRSKKFFEINLPEERGYEGSPSAAIYEEFPQKFPEAFHNALTFIEDPNTFDQIDDIPSNFLLHGAPGCGKSYLGELISREFQTPYVKIRATNLEDRYYGGSSEKIEDIFNAKTPNGKPLLLLIEEFDAISTRRREGMSEALRSMVSGLLDALDRNRKGAFFTFATTNHKHAIDNALLERFSGIEIEAMSPDARKKFITKMVEKLPIKKEEKNGIIETITKEADGLQRRGIKKALKNAHLRALRIAKIKSEATITLQDFSLCIEQEKDHLKVPFTVKVSRFVTDTQPYLNYIISVLNIGNFFWSEWKYNTNKQEQKDDKEYNRKRADEDRAFNYMQFILAQAQRAKDKFERDRWEKYHRYMQLVTIEMNGRNSRNEMEPICKALEKNSNITFEEAKEISGIL